MESKNARFAVLIDPRKKRMFLEICAAHDLTPSQVVRQLMREYIIEHTSDRELPEWLLKAAIKNDARASSGISSKLRQARKKRLEALTR